MRWWCSLVAERGEHCLRTFLGLRAYGGALRYWCEVLGAWFGLVWKVSGYDGRRRACVGGEKKRQGIGWVDRETTTS